MYWKVAEAYTEKYGSQQFPCLIDTRNVGFSFHTYALPISEYLGYIKVCPHDGPKINPDERDNGTDDSWAEEGTVGIVSSTFQGLDTKPSIREYCIYTATPDNHPFIDRHPGYSNIVIAAGFSGHGFKLAPAIGKAVTDLVLKRKPSYNMEPFKISRFQTKSNL
uniref:FAD dependent oxidoreductase domain-containing protein n=2 Tax=Arion vulgaris TaxID=1028688 RepID=A0A0B7AHK3_9EUPU